MNLLLIRSVYGPDHTMGDLLIDHRLYCHTLEDRVRPQGAPKIPGETAIAAGRYELIVSDSPHFKRPVPMLVGVPGFTGIRMHGGNTAKDTHGCIIVARDIIGPGRVQGSMEAELTKLLLEHKETNHIEIIDTFPYHA